MGDRMGGNGKSFALFIGSSCAVGVTPTILEVGGDAHAP